VLRSLWTAIGEAFAAERAEAKTTVEDYLKRLDPAWNVVGRVHFAGAYADNLNWGMEAATRSANRVAEAIDAA